VDLLLRSPDVTLATLTLVVAAQRMGAPGLVSEQPTVGHEAQAQLGKHAVGLEPNSTRRFSLSSLPLP
jgi:hypothetical protein